MPGTAAGSTASNHHRKLHKSQANKKEASAEKNLLSSKPGGEPPTHDPSIPPQLMMGKPSFNSGISAKEVMQANMGSSRNHDFKLKQSLQLQQ